MKIITASLSGAALDWAVAVCEGLIQGNETTSDADLLYDCKEVNRLLYRYKPSSEGEAGIGIIERENIKLTPIAAFTHWHACKLDSEELPTGEGKTPLIAAMRCYCSSKLGDEVEVPDELLQKG